MRDTTFRRSIRFCYKHHPGFSRNFTEHGAVPVSDCKNTFMIWFKICITHLMLVFATFNLSWWQRTIYMDVDQAVPIRLIRNEIITNAIKYAFGIRGRSILVSIRRDADNLIKPIVYDNVKGLPRDFEFVSSNTPVMEIMKGLGKQLRGEMKRKQQRPNSLGP